MRRGLTNGLGYNDLESQCCAAIDPTVMREVDKESDSRLSLFSKEEIRGSRLGSPCSRKPSRNEHLCDLG